jgi:hypothetical protein
MVTELEGQSTSKEPLVFMRFRPAWAYIDGIREFGRFFCETTLSDSEAAERARVVLQEALENAVKYSTPGPNSELELCITAREGELEIAVTSLPEPEHLDSLREEIEALNAKDATQAYVDAIARAADSPDAAARLGLARMRLEGKVQLTVEDRSGGRIRVTARGIL